LKKSRKQPTAAEILPHLIRESGWEIQLDLHSVFADWRKIAAPEIADHCRPVKIRRGVLWLEVENSAWLQQLRFQKHQLLEAVNATLKHSSFQDIKLILPEKNTQKNQEKSSGLCFVSPPPEAVAAFERQIAFIDDEKCREALLRFWYLAQACRREEGFPGSAKN
jgi:hypothetical protein